MIVGYFGCLKISSETEKLQKSHHTYIDGLKCIVLMELPVSNDPYFSRSALPCRPSCEMGDWYQNVPNDSEDVSWILLESGQLISQVGESSVSVNPAGPNARS